MSSDRQLSLWIVLAMLFWGASWPIANILSNYINAHEFISYRYIVTTLTMVPVLWWMKLSFKIDLKSLLVASVAAVFLIYYSKYYFLSTKFGAPGLAGAVVTTLMPVLVYMLMMFSKQNKTQLKDWLALLLGIFGVLTTMNIWQFQLSDVVSGTSVYLLAAATCWALMSIVTTYVKTVAAATLSFYIYLMTALFDLLFFFEPTHGSIFAMDGVFWLNFLIVTIGSTTFATTVYFLGIAQLGSKRASVFTFLVPFFAVGLNVLFLNEHWYWTTILGALMTISALIMLNNIKLNLDNNQSLDKG
ncbi:MAG: DMT family transporter [Proteobacteria bacterium]|nr:DMT family transporter [Pseudomonadota bacterium]